MLLPMFHHTYLTFFDYLFIFSKVPKEYVKDFTCESNAKNEKLEYLKAWVHRNKAEIYKE